MVHDGNDKGGHYYSYIRPNPEGDWFKFNDASVTRATSKEAIEDNFGDDEEDEKMRTNFSNAYAPPTHTCDRQFANNRALMDARALWIPGSLLALG